MSGWWDDLVRSVEEGVRTGMLPDAPKTGRGLFSNPFLSERDREQAELRAAFRAAEAEWRTSPLSNASSTDVAIEILKAATRDLDPVPAFPILEQVARGFADILETDADLGDLVPNWRALDDDLALAAEFRAALKRRGRWVTDFGKFSGIYLHRAIAAFRPFLTFLPNNCYGEWPSGGFGVPLIELLEDPADAVERFVLFPYDDDVFRYDLFPRLRRTLERNMMVASGLPPTADPQENEHRIVLPTKHKRVSSVELAEMYLEGTPLLDILQVPVPFKIEDDARFEHCHIIGGTGHGKTQLMQQLIYSDLERAIHERRSVVVIDSQGDLIAKLTQLELFAPELLGKHLVLVDPTDVEFPFSLNLFDTKLDRLANYTPADRERVLNGVVELYETFFGALLGAELTSKQNIIFRYLARLMMAIPGATIETLMQIMEDGRPFKGHMERLDGSARHFFESEFFDPSFAATKKQILRRLWGVLSTPAFERMFRQKENKLDLFAAMNEGKIILINTAKDLLKTEGSQLFGRFFIGMIAQAAFERSTLPREKRTPAFVYIDEAQEYFDDNIESILNQARKYGVGLTIAHQTLDQLSPRLRATLLANTSVKCAGGVSARDASALAPEMRTDSDFIESMRRRRDRTEFAVWVKHTTPQAIRLSAPLGFLERQRRIGEAAFDALLEQNRARYCGRLYVEVEHAPKLMPSSESAVPVVPARADPQPRATAAPPPAAASMPPSPQPHPPPQVRSTSPQELGKGGPKHRYLQNLVKELAEAQGLRAVIEGTFGVANRHVDVLIERESVLAVVEISVSTPAAWEREQIAACLREGAPRLALVLAKSKRVEARYRTAVVEGLTEEERARITFLSAEEVPAFIETLVPPAGPEETMVRGYKVRVSRSDVSPEEAKRRQEALARLVARSLVTKRRDD